MTDLYSSLSPRHRARHRCRMDGCQCRSQHDADHRGLCCDCFDATLLDGYPFDTCCRDMGCCQTKTAVAL